MIGKTDAMQQVVRSVYGKTTILSGLNVQKRLHREIAQKVFLDPIVQTSRYLEAYVLGARLVNMGRIVVMG